MSLVISSVFTYDTDAGNYIQAVEAADEAASPGIGPLEPATRKAINDFVIGCKQDGIWDAIKASCILSGARTLAGALVPLVGTAPTNNGPFVAGDYNRKTGLVGSEGKYLDSNRACSLEAQNNLHASVFASTRDSSLGRYLGSATTGNRIEMVGNATGFRARVNSTTLDTLGTSTATSVLVGISRNASTSYNWKYGSQAGSQATVSAAVSTGNYSVFAMNDGSIATNARLAFYSIGESLDLAKLDGRVTDLINKFSEVIP